jgi:hypothetical protein
MAGAYTLRECRRGVRAEVVVMQRSRVHAGSSCAVAALVLLATACKQEPANGMLGAPAYGAGAGAGSAGVAGFTTAGAGAGAGVAGTAGTAGVPAVAGTGGVAGSGIAGMAAEAGAGGAAGAPMAGAGGMAGAAGGGGGAGGMGASGASGGGAGMGGGGASGASFAQVYTIMMTSCGGGLTGCHITGSSGRLAMPNAAAAYDALVGVDSTECDGETRVVAGDADASLLVKVLEDTACVDRMPRGRAALSAADIATIRSWIDAGAAEH